jgi:UPF0271 protein
MIVDLNRDMGEGLGVYRLGGDAGMPAIASSANIACGFHAGDPLVMHETLTLAARAGVQAGAHPGFLDLWGFGRRPIHGERPADVEKAVLQQVGALLALAQDAGCPVRHVKTHGALGNIANEDADRALAVARAIYADTGNPVSRKLPGAVLHDPVEAAERVVQMIEDGAIVGLSGRRIPARIDSIRADGDTRGAVAMAAQVRADLADRGIAVRPMAEATGA